MSTTSTPNDSPIQPLHNPSLAAHVSLPQAPLGNATNGPISQATSAMGAKALLAKKMAKGRNPTYISPTDNLVTPVSQKLNAAKKNHFNKGLSKPMPQLFGQQAKSSVKSSESDDDGDDSDADIADEDRGDSLPLSPAVKMVEDDSENPF